MPKFNWLQFSSIKWNWKECRQVRLALWDYASERLPEEMMERVERHLQHCSGCQHEHKILDHTQEFLRACRAEEEPAPRTGWEQLRARLENEMPDATLLRSFTATAIGPVTTDAFEGNAADWERRVARAFFPMQLMTAFAGSCAMIALLAAGYGITHMRPAQVPSAVYPGIVANQPSDASSIETGKTVLDNMASILSNVHVASDGSGTSELVASETRSAPRSEMRGEKPSGTRINPNAVTVTHASVGFNSRKKQDTLRRWELASATQNGKGTSALRSGGTKRASRMQIVRRTDGSNNLKFRSYTPKPEERLTDSTQSDSHYILQRVRPVSIEIDEPAINVVGRVQPAQRDEDRDY